MFYRPKFMAAFLAAAAITAPIDIPFIRPKAGPIDKKFSRPVVTRAERNFSRYMPHQGPRECARRVRQMAKAAAKAGVA